MEQKWLDEFIRLYFSGAPVDAKNALELKNRNMPDYLFKYRDLTLGSNTNKSFTIDNIVNKTIHFSDVQRFNEPLDTFARCNEYFTSDRYISTYIRKHDLSKKLNREEVEMNLKEIINSLRESIKVCCFSESKDIHSRNMPMWFHYANKFQGVCLQYNMRSPSVSGNCSPLQHLLPIEYNSKIIDIADYIAGNIPIRTIGRRVTMRKHASWKYEHEWRLVHDGEMQGHKNNHVFDTLVGIYMGYKIDSVHKKQLYEIASKQMLHLYEMKLTARGVEFISLLS
jgi:hypothetical protein